MSKTVEIIPTPDQRVVKMIWQHQINPQDVSEAFKTLNDMLGDASDPIHVIVDLRQNPRFPLTTTIVDAIAPYRHTMLRTWLVIGGNSVAKLIEKTLSMVSGKENVSWFDTEAEVMEHLIQTGGIEIADEAQSA